MALGLDLYPCDTSTQNRMDIDQVRAPFRDMQQLDLTSIFPSLDATNDRTHLADTFHTYAEVLPHDTHDHIVSVCTE